MFELKITGNTAEELKQNVMKTAFAYGAIFLEPGEKIVPTQELNDLPEGAKTAIAAAAIVADDIRKTSGRGRPKGAKNAKPQKKEKTVSKKPAEQETKPKEETNDETTVKHEDIVEKLSQVKDDISFAAARKILTSFNVKRARELTEDQYREFYDACVSALKKDAV